jgi:hypothetical protein
LSRTRFFGSIVVIAITASVSLGAQDAVVSGQHWRLVNLGTFVPHAINNINFVAGEWSETGLNSYDGAEIGQFGAGGFCSPDPNRQAAVYGDGVVTLLGAGPGSAAYGINDRRWMVGYQCESFWSDYEGDYINATVPFSVKNGVVSPMRLDNRVVGAARGINYRGDIVGWLIPDADWLFFWNPPTRYDAMWSYKLGPNQYPSVWNSGNGSVNADDGVNKTGAYIFEFNEGDEAVRTVCDLVTSTGETLIPDADVWDYSRPSCQYASINDNGNVAANTGFSSDSLSPYVFSAGVLTYLSPGFMA